MADRLNDNPSLPALLRSAPTADGTLPAEDRRAMPATPEEVFDLVDSQVRKLAGGRDVEELVQVAAEQAIRSLPQFKGLSQLSTWTFRISYLTIKKHDRWYRRWLRRFTLTEDGELPERADVELPADAQIAATERVERLRQALGELSPRRRAVVVLHDLEGMPVDEVAKVVGVTVVAVRSRLRDARHQLAALLASDEYFGDAACRRTEEP